MAKVFVFSDSIDRYAELCGGARQLGAETAAVVVGSRADADKVASYGVNNVYWLGEMPADRMVEDYVPTMAGLGEAHNPSLWLVGATRRGKAVAARLGVMLKAGVVNDATAITEQDGKPVASHLVQGGLGNSLEKITSAQAVVTLGTGSFEPAMAGAAAPVTQVEYVQPRAPIKCVARQPKPVSSVDLTKAKRVVGVGRGFAAKDDIALAEAFAAAIGAEVGCSRPVAEGENWMEKERYVGISGVKLNTDIYVAIGISGQIQHMVGASASKIIVAINKDKNAPIFQKVDYGLVGDLYKVLPALTSRVKG